MEITRGAFHWQGRPLPELEQARVLGRVEKPIAPNGVVHVRIDGVDAPELHYRPTPPPWLGPRERARYDAANATFVQPFGKSAARGLAEHLGEGTLPCVVRTLVPSPTEAFDIYGRMIGVFTAGPHDIGKLLLSHGYAVPTFYETTPLAEIRAYTALARAARHHGTSVFPKLFRRACAWHVERTARLTELAFRLQGGACGSASCGALSFSLLLAPDRGAAPQHRPPRRECAAFVMALRRTHCTAHFGH